MAGTPILRHRENDPETEGDWRKRLAHVVETVREMSGHTDPQAMVDNYRRRMRQVIATDGAISLSRRDLDWPKYRITRSNLWKEQINPWKQKDHLPILEGGLLGELIYGDEPRIIDDLRPDEDDPAAEHLAGQRSLIAIPLYDKGVSLNMVVLMRRAPAAFGREDFPNLVLTSNLFGRATHNLVLSTELREAYEQVDMELKAIAEIQRSLLPGRLPEIPTMQLASYYQTARRAGGDYYDFFPLPEGRWGILLADVSGHGTPAAVMMAITHSLAHACPAPSSPSAMLHHLNEQLWRRYTNARGTFVTAFYGVYEPGSRELTYSSAGHNPPRLKRCADGSVFSLDKAGGLPLGILDGQTYDQGKQAFRPGDQIIFYTDGITEAMNRAGEMFAPRRLDAVLGDCLLYASDLIQRVVDAVADFTEGLPPDDDRTVLVAKIS